MNIENTWKNLSLPFERDTVVQFFKDRETVFRGFLEREIQKGTYESHHSINTPAGQDQVRTFLFRFLEEIAESLDSNDINHIKEEMIDAINYLWSLPFLMGLTLDDLELNLFDMVFTGFRHPYKFVPGNDGKLPDTAVVSILMYTAADFPDTLRNRSWMENAQDEMFVGWASLYDMVASCTSIIFSMFKDWDDFCSFYYAKHRVLEFRLETKY